MLILSETQQKFLHELAHSDKGLPIYPVGQGSGSRAGSRAALAMSTTLLETFIGRDGSKWVRLTEAGRLFVDATK